MITVIGLGFVGLTTALGFCNKGFKVYGYDISKEKIDCLKNKEIPFHEPHLQEILEQNINENFFIDVSLKQALDNSDIIFCCVGTPSREDGSADLKYIYEVIEDIMQHLNKDDFKVLVIKSTIPPSTSEEKIVPFIEKLGFEIGKDIGLTNNPEFLREGYAWDDFINPDRIVIGQHDEKSGLILEELYKTFDATIYRVSLNTSEFIKYLSNTLLSTLISFSNEMSLVAHSIGDIDIPESFKILHKDRRWFGEPANMTSYVFPGCGFGGYCLPKDIKALYSKAKSKGYTPKLIEEVLNINSKTKEFVVRTIAETVNDNEYIGVLGLSFKPESDDVRDTPSKDIINGLLSRGYTNIVAYDPLANENFKEEYSLQIQYADTFEELSEKANVIVILTGWKEFFEKQDIIKDKKVLNFRYYVT